MSAGPFAVDKIANAAVVADVDAVVAADKGLVFYGFSAHESAGVPAAAHFHIKDAATGATGTEVVSIQLPASGNEKMWVGDRGIHCPNGISIEWVSGQIDITIYYKVFP